MYQEYKEDREARFEVEEENVISRNLYNMVLGGAVLWGLLINVIMSLKFMDAILEMNILVFLLAYLIGSVICTSIVYKSSNPIVSFVAYTFMSIFMGLLLTSVVSEYDIGTISLAFITTVMVALIMIAVSFVYPDFFEEIEVVLFAILCVTIVVELIVALVLGETLTMFDFVIAAVFCGYIGYDFAKAQDYQPTFDNAVDSAADIYVDIVVLFIRVLEIIGKAKDD